MKNNLLLTAFLLAVAISSCKKDEPTEPTQPVTPNPIDTTGTGDTTKPITADTNYTNYALFELFKNNEDGKNLKNTVDSIRFTNTTTGFTKKWTKTQIKWETKSNGQFYTGYGWYCKNYIKKPSSGDKLTYMVHFNQNDSERLIFFSYDDLPQGSAGIPYSGFDGLFYKSLKTW